MRKTYCRITAFDFVQMVQNKCQDTKLVTMKALLALVKMKKHSMFSRCTACSTEQFLYQGYFLVKRTHTGFTATWSDKIFEYTMNMDAKTTAGIIGEQMDERQTEASISISIASTNGFMQVDNVQRH